MMTTEMIKLGLIGNEVYLKLRYHLFKVAVLFVFIALPAFGDPITKENNMTLSGSFEVTLEPQQDEVAPAGRMIIHKVYSGALQGEGTGQMVSKRTSSGDAVYFAIEEFTGVLEGKKGGFTLLHKGFMSASSESLDIDILPGSGSGQLEGIRGSMSIIRDGGSHSYSLSVQL